MASNDEAVDRREPSARPPTVPLPSSRRLKPFLLRWGGLGAMVLAVVALSVANPSDFPTRQNLTNILGLSAIPVLAAVGLTVVLVLGDFDLSFGAIISLSGALVVVLMSKHGFAWPAAAAAAIAIGACAGALNGVLVAYAGTSALITTLATGSVLQGFQYYITSQKTLYSGISPSFVSVARGEAFLIPNIAWIALITTAALSVTLHKTQFGRFMYAIGSNVEAARLAGVRTEIMRTIGFTITGAVSALAGVVLAAQAASSYPDSGTPYLLSSYAGAFLGAAVLSRWGSFSPIATMVGAVFLIIVQIGLTMLNLETWVIYLFQGLVLLVAVSVTRLDSAKR